MLTKKEKIGVSLLSGFLIFFLTLILIALFILYPLNSTLLNGSFLKDTFTSKEAVSSLTDIMSQSLVSSLEEEGFDVRYTEGQEIVSEEFVEEYVEKFIDVIYEGGEINIDSTTLNELVDDNIVPFLQQNSSMTTEEIYNYSQDIKDSFKEGLSISVDEDESINGALDSGDDFFHASSSGDAGVALDLVETLEKINFDGILNALIIVSIVIAALIIIMHASKCRAIIKLGVSLLISGLITMGFGQILKELFRSVRAELILEATDAGTEVAAINTFCDLLEMAFKPSMNMGYIVVGIAVVAIIAGYVLNIVLSKRAEENFVSDFNGTTYTTSNDSPFNDPNNNF